MGSLPQGIYNLKITSAGKIFSSKIIINH
ncbi:MAG: hypothetical protein LH473_08275 [Chitinophagales bacterium]|nr:hypothetical protein [Chitinophagales bacterium]